MRDYNNYITAEIREAFQATGLLFLIRKDIERASELILNSIISGGKVMICGNGGSAADSQHMAAELVGRFEKNRKGMPAIALSTDTSNITSIANDYSFANIYKRQVEALGKKEDVLIGITTSGNSENIVEALKFAKEKGIKTISFSGSSNGKVDIYSDIKIKVPSSRTCRIQELHGIIIHIICGIIEQEISKISENSLETPESNNSIDIPPFIKSDETSKSLNIAIFTNAYKPIISGVVNCIDLMRKNLQKKGHNVYIFAPNFQDYEDPKDENVFRYPSLNLTNKVKYPIPLPFYPKAEKFLSENQIDIIHCHHPFILGEEGAKWATKLNVPLFFTFHTQYEMYSHYIPLPQDFVKSVSKSVVFSFTKKCSVIITPGTAIVDLIKNDYGITQNVIYMKNSIDLDDFQNPNRELIRKKYEIKDDEKLLIYVGRMAPEKNIPFMLDSFKKISDKISSKLLIVGEGSEYENLKQYANEHQLEDKVIFTGRIEYKDIPNYYGASDLFIMTSKTEVKPLALLEAMATGLPVVAISACGASDTIIDGANGYLTSEDRDEFASKVLEILSDDQKLKNMSNESIKIAESYSADKMTDKLIELYREEIRKMRRIR